MTIKVKNIDTSTIDGKIAVMQAYKDGARIACTPRGDATRWVSCSPVWAWASYDYSVIEEPQEMWVVQELLAGDILSTYVCETPEQAEAWAAKNNNPCSNVVYRVVKFVEVQE